MHLPAVTLDLKDYRSKSTLLYTHPDIIVIFEELTSKANDVYGLDIIFFGSHKDSLVCPIAHLINLSRKQGIFPNTHFKDW